MAESPPPEGPERDLSAPQEAGFEVEQLVDPEVVVDRASERLAEQAGQKVSQVVEQQLEITEHIGPLPSPSTLAAYDERFPGLGQQIVAWTDSEIRHRQRMQTDAVQSAIMLGRRGQFIGVLIVVLAFIAIFLGRSVEGLVALAPIVVAFVGAQAAPTISRLRAGSEETESAD